MAGSWTSRHASPADCKVSNARQAPCDSARFSRCFGWQLGHSTPPPAVLNASLSPVRVGYYAKSSYHQGEEHVVIDYRFLVPTLLPGAHQDPDDILMYGGRYDVTNQVVVVVATLDGKVVKTTQES